MSSILRNLPQLPEFVVAWDFPLMQVASDLNPDALRRPQTKNKVCSDKEFLDAVITNEGKSLARIASDSKAQFAMSQSTTQRALKRLVEAGLIRHSYGLYWRDGQMVTSLKE